MITDVADFRTTALGNVTITFSEAVTGVDMADFRLTRNGQPLMLTEARLNGAGTSYVLDNLSELTGSTGNYVLTLAVEDSGITDIAGNNLLEDASSTWTMEDQPGFAIYLPFVGGPFATTVTLSN
jgi:hypothetical protein